MIKKNKKFIFYKTTYNKNGKYYYGSHHGYENDEYRGSSKIIKNIIKKHGISELIRENLKFFNSKEEMMLFEDKFLKLWDLASDKNSFNMKNSAQGGNTTINFTDKQKRDLSEKLSKANKGRKITWIDKIKNKLKGKSIHQNSIDGLVNGKKKWMERNKEYVKEMYKEIRLKNLEINKNRTPGEKEKIRLKRKLKRDERMIEKIGLVINSKINFSKLGWVNKVSELTGIPHGRIRTWMKEFMKDFYEEKCFKVKRGNI